MYKFESSIFINRPVQEVFDFVTNPANDAKGLSKNNLTDSEKARTFQKRRDSEGLSARKVESCAEREQRNQSIVVFVKSVESIHTVLKRQTIDQSIVC